MTYTKEEIINKAREAGWDSYDSLDERFGRFAALVQQCSIRENLPDEIGAAIAREREACVKVCDELQDVPATEPRHCAEDIRARGQA